MGAVVRAGCVVGCSLIGSVAVAGNGCPVAGFVAVASAVAVAGWWRCHARGFFEAARACDNRLLAPVTALRPGRARPATPIVGLPYSGHWPGAPATVRAWRLPSFCVCPRMARVEEVLFRSLVAASSLGPAMRPARRPAVIREATRAAAEAPAVFAEVATAAPAPVPAVSAVFAELAPAAPAEVPAVPVAGAPAGWEPVVAIKRVEAAGAVTEGSNASAAAPEGAGCAVAAEA